MKLRLPFFALLTFPLIAVAQSADSYVCTMGELTRRVAVERSGSTPAACEVAYYKDSEAPGERQVLWNAQNDGSYCGARATEFVSQLEGWNWQCAAASMEPATTAENEGDDAEN